MRSCIRIITICVIVLSFPSFVLASKTHKVKKNETLFSLAKKYRIPVAELKAANNLVHNHVKKGDVLVIPPRTAVADADERVGSGTSKSATYKVRKGETLTRIAKKTGVSISELKRLNGLAKGKIKPGQVLVLRDATPSEEPTQRVARKVILKNSDLFNEKDYEQSLADLTEPDPSQPVDLTQNLELKTDNIKMLKKAAYGFLGTRYRFGGSSRTGLDCSAFVQKVFLEMDVTLPRTAREQFEIGNRVAPGDLQKGDLVFFRTYAPYASHVGIYLGDNRMIHASSRDRRVVVSSIDTPYYRSRYLGAKRIGKINPEIFKFDDLLIGIEEESPDDANGNDTLGISLNN